LLSCMCQDGTQCRQGSLDAPDATRCGVLVQDAQDAQDAESESGRNTTVRDADYIFADVFHPVDLHSHADASKPIPVNPPR